MKKVLLVGELNQTMSSVNQHLANKFQTQICMDSYELVKEMVKVFLPDMVVVCLVGGGTLDTRILELFYEKYSHIKVLLIGTEDVCKYYQKYEEKEQFYFLERPTTLSVLMKKCLELLNMEVESDEEETVKMQKQSEGRKTILAVDDSAILLRSVKAMLEKNYDVIVANSGKVAIRQAKKRTPDLILLDYEMPEWDGKKTLEEIRNDEELKEIPVLFLTAVADKAHISAVLKLYPSGYLLKPIEQQKLLDTIEKVLGGVV